MRKLFLVFCLSIFLCGLAQADQVDITTGSWLSLRTNLNANFDELYAKWLGLGSTYDTSAELAALFAGKQDADADLTIYAGITPSANLQATIGAADYAAARALWDLEPGVDFYSISGVDTAIETAIAGMAGGHDAVTLGTANGLSLTGQILNLSAATNITAGAMTAAYAQALEAIDTDAEIVAKIIDEDFSPTGTWDFSGAASFSVGPLKLADSATSPTEVGHFRYKNDATGLDDGALCWYDDDEIKYLVDVTTLPTTDGQVPSYNATTKKWVPTIPSSGSTVTTATAAEINTGTDNTKVVTPDSLAGSNAFTKDVAWTIYNSDTDTAVGDGKQFYVIPASLDGMIDGMNLIDVTASVHDLNSATGGTTNVTVRRVRGATAVDMTSTGVTVGYDEYFASDETVDTSNDDVQTGDRIFIDVDTVTTGAVHKGLSVTCLFRLH